MAFDCRSPFAVTKGEKINCTYCLQTYNRKLPCRAAVLPFEYD